MADALRIAVIADTHDRLPEWLPGELAQADEIWHLGDVCGEWLLDELRAIGPPLTVVRGNCDSNSAWPLEVRLKRPGLNILLVHIPPAGPDLRGADLLLHGHTHIPRNEKIGATRFLNPGCITRPKTAGRSYAWLTLDPGGSGYSWELRRF